MAITLDSGYKHEEVSSVSSYNTSVTCPSLTDGCMSVTAAFGAGVPNYTSISSITFNGDSFTDIINGGERTSYSAMGGGVLVNPDNTTANVTINLNRTQGGRKTIYLFMHEGVDQTTPVDDSVVTRADTGTAKTAALTTTVDDCWIVGGFHSDSYNLTAGTGTKFWTASDSEITVTGNEYGSLRMADSNNGTVGSAGSKSINATLASSGEAISIGIALAPAAGGGGGAANNAVFFGGGI